MPSETNEQALESTIEKRLTGTSLEVLKVEGSLSKKFIRYMPYWTYPLFDYNSESQFGLRLSYLT